MFRFPGEQKSIIKKNQEFSRVCVCVCVQYNKYMDGMHGRMSFSSPEDVRGSCLFVSGGWFCMTNVIRAPRAQM